MNQENINLRCIIVDDEYLAIRILEEYSARIPALTILQSFKDPLQALGFLRSHEVDLLFLDIQMPHISGVDLVGQLTLSGGTTTDTVPFRSSDEDSVTSPAAMPAAGSSGVPLIVFTTARHEFAVQAFELDALDYLVKPISFERFEKTIRKAAEYLCSPGRSLKPVQPSLPTPPALPEGVLPLDPSGPNAPDCLLIKSDHRTIKLLYTEISLIEGLNEYVRVHIPGKKIITLAALKDLEATLPGGRFIRIHRSYIVSRTHIRSWSASEVEMEGGLRLPVGRVYKENFLRWVRL